MQQNVSYHNPNAHDQDPTSQILTLWSSPSLLPTSLPLPQPPSHDLLAALLSLANLTPNQSERAWNLISTYFHARIREASYTGRGNGGVYAVVEEEDVLKACGSVRRMSVGMGIETGVHRENSEPPSESNDATGNGKRKWSIRDEITGTGEMGGDGDGVKRTDTQSSTSTLAQETYTGTELPPLPAILDMPPNPESASQDRIELPPIYTLTSHKVPLETLIEAARGAMYEKNLRRREMEDAEEIARLARGRYMEARRLAERLRGEVKRKGERDMGLR